MSRSERNFARRIDLTSLQLFVAVCELGSIGRAAEREFLAASAVSKKKSLKKRKKKQFVILCLFFSKVIAL